MFQSGIESKTKLLVIQTSALTIELSKHDEHIIFLFCVNFSHRNPSKNISIV
jgi:hypothetical protein